jgi:hypothetical protein
VLYLFLNALCLLLPPPPLLSLLLCRREYNRRVREVVEQSWVEQDA